MQRVEALIVAERGEQSYIIDKGANDGVIVGMRFAILGPDLSVDSSRLAKRFEGTAAPVKQVAKVVEVEDARSIVKVFRSTRQIIERGLIYLATPSAASIVAPAVMKTLFPLRFAPYITTVLISAIVRYLRDRRNMIPHAGDRVIQIIGQEAQDSVEVPPV